MRDSRMSRLRRVVDSHMRRVYGLGLRELCDRCLRTERWGGSVVLMVVDVSFTSIGLNYFTAVVPKVEEFNRKFVEAEKIRRLRDLAKADISELRGVWRNRRSWIVAKEVASYLSTLSGDDREALRTWAGRARYDGGCRHGYAR